MQILTLVALAALPLAAARIGKLSFCDTTPCMTDDQCMDCPGTYCPSTPFGVTSYCKAVGDIVEDSICGQSCGVGFPCIWGCVCSNDGNDGSGTCLDPEEIERLEAVANARIGEKLVNEDAGGSVEGGPSTSYARSYAGVTCGDDCTPGGGGCPESCPYCGGPDYQWTCRKELDSSPESPDESACNQQCDPDDEDSCPSTGCSICKEATGYGRGSFFCAAPLVVVGGATVQAGTTTTKCTGESVDLPTDQCSAWSDFYDSTQGTYWGDGSCSRTDPCGCSPVDGYGVTCGMADGVPTVQIVSLTNCNLRGTLPDSIGAWVDLTKFDVDHNSLTGSLPSTLSQWTKLTLSDGFFDVSMNGLSGVLPALPFAQMPQAPEWARCRLLSHHYGGTNSFDCPWPKGATEACDKWVQDPTFTGWAPITDSDCGTNGTPEEYNQ